MLSFEVIDRSFKELLTKKVGISLLRIYDLEGSSISECEEI